MTGHPAAPAEWFFPEDDAVLRVFRSFSGAVLWKRALPRHLTGWGKPFHATLRSDLSVILRLSKENGPVVMTIAAADVFPLSLGPSPAARAVAARHWQDLDAARHRVGQLRSRPELPTVGEVLQVLAVAWDHQRGYLWARHIPKYASGWGRASWLRLRCDLALELQHGSTSDAPRSVIDAEDVLRFLGRPELLPALMNYRWARDRATRAGLRLVKASGPDR